MTAAPNISESQFNSLTPILNVGNIPNSINYYVNILGFKKDWDWGEPPTFASVSRDDVCIFLCQGAQGQPGTWMSIFVDNVDFLYENYKAKGAIIRQAPTNFPWGMREMNIEDPDGHRLRMSSETNEPSDEISLCED
ncbi:MAG: bleomycin resistance family protein [Symploca sp. SIO3C6]|uniref:Bleomycin resistance family protein n=1 Tax=Symploca sp. SIO1C4 TaxID=2607765 RepID=A0A6B3N263_9CYAN|nr:bleomycin resistance family protein [Symploca sp. SIO3C6]NER27786.1 bleomycin resistance family protein [Symploca sp. SIO1C4]